MHLEDAVCKSTGVAAAAEALLVVRAGDGAVLEQARVTATRVLGWVGEGARAPVVCKPLAAARYLKRGAEQEDKGGPELEASYDHLVSYLPEANPLHPITPSSTCHHNCIIP